MTTKYVSNYFGDDPQLPEEFRQIALSIEDLNHYHVPVADMPPLNPQKGQIVYANSTNWDPGAGSGLYSFDGTTWNKIGVAGGGGATQLDELSDVSTAAATNRFALMGNGSVYNGRALTEADVSDLQAYLVDAPSDGAQYGRKDGSWEVIVINTEITGISGLGIWRYRTETGEPPSSGQIRFNNANISAATEFYVHETNNDGTDVSTFMELLLQTGSILYVQDQSAAANHLLIEIGSSSDEGTYRKYTITSIIEEGTEPNQNQKVILVVGGAVSGGGSSFLDITLTDFADVTNYYYGGTRNNGDWQINRYLKTTLVKTSADEAGNPSETSLGAAWTNRTTLTYT